MKKYKLLILTAILLTILCSCGDDTKPNPDNPVTLTMWHNYGGDMQETMDYLIDQFNTTKGKELGITINVTAISSSSELNKSLEMIANGDPGAPEAPDIFTGYPKIAVSFKEKDLIINYDDYITDDTLDLYVDDFIDEGRFGNDGLYVFPIAKSTEIMYLNKTLFDKFASETGADDSLLSTFEGIAKLSKDYYAWTDAKTPDIKNDGKQFYAADSWFNFTEVAMEQLGTSIINEDTSFNFDNESFKYIMNTIYDPAVKGGFAIYDGYSSDLSKTGDLICSTGSSAGILFYGDTVTYEDGTIEQVEYSILPYPIFENGKNIALQRGGGLIVSKSSPQKEYAACEFIKWLTAPEQNMQFISSTGYLPVTKQAFENDIKKHLDTLTDNRIKKMLTAVLSMYENYEFFTAPNHLSFDDDSTNFETKLRAVLTKDRNSFLNNENYSFNTTINELTN